MALKAPKWDMITQNVPSFTPDFLIIANFLCTMHWRLVDILNGRLTTYGIMNVTSMTKALNRLNHEQRQKVALT